MKVSIGVQASWLAAASAASYIGGLVRDRLLAAQFGAGAELDVYNSAFLIPDIIMNLFAAALTAAFIPVFTQWQHKEGMTSAWQMTNVLISCLVVVMFSVCVLAFFLMPWLTPLIAPGFDETAQRLLISTSRLMLLSPLAFALSTAIGAALQGVNRFFSYALSPVLYNIGIILGIIFLAPRFGIRGVVIGVVSGAALHMLIRLLELLKTGWRWQWRLEWTHPALRQTVRLMLPRVAGLLTVQGNLWIYNALASTLVVGSIAVFNLARNFQSLPVSFFAIALATVIFPQLSAHFAATEQEKLVQLADRAIRQLAYCTLPAAAGMIMLAYPLVATFLGSGKFDEAAVAATSMTLAIFALSIPFESIQHILARVFYAQHDTVTPVKIALLGLAVNAMVCVGTVRLLGVLGLALGFTATAASQVIVLIIALRRRGQRVVQRGTVFSVFKSVAISLIMVTVVWLAQGIFIPLWLRFIGSAVIGITVYALLSYWLHIPEFHATVQSIQKIWKSVRGIHRGTHVAS